MSRLSKLFYSALLCSCLGTAHALSLGGIRAITEIGVPLEVYVEVLLSPSDRTQNLQASVLPDFVASRNPSMATLVAGLKASVVQVENGRAGVRIASSAVVSDPVLPIRLKVSAGTRAISAHYVLRLIAPAPAPVARPITNPQRRVQPQAPVSVSGDRYGPVRSGETLSSIARHTHPGGGVQAWMQAIHAANQTAFIGGDINRLKAGVILRLPEAQSPADVATQTAAVTNDDTASATKPVTASPSATAPAPIVTAAATADPVHLAKAVDSEFSARMTALDLKFKAIRAKYAAPSGAAQTVARAATMAAASPTTVVAERATTSPPPAVPAAVTATPVVNAVTPPATDQTGTRKPDESAGYSQLLIGVGMILGMIVLLVAGRAIWLRKLKRRSIVQHQGLEIDRKAEVTRKAENRVRLETEVRDMLNKKKQPRGEQTDAEISSPPTVAAEAPVVQPARVLSEQDRNIQIDSSLTHGRYVEAEGLLLEVIAATPRNFGAKLRLAEVYYITERVEEFIAIAKDLHQTQRAELSDEEWQRVVRMGKIIAPDTALFSGPRAVSRPAAKAG